MKNSFINLKAAVGPENYEENVMLKQLTTFHCGGPAAVLVSPASMDEVVTVTGICENEQIPYFMLGRGSNLLVSDQGFDGVVISLRKNLNRIIVKENRIIAQAGAMMPAIAFEACKHGLSGLEFASGIPGTIGGGLIMNAGAYGGDLNQVIIDAAVLTKEGNICVLTREELQLSYRHSALIETGDIVLSVTLELTPGNQEDIKKTMDHYNRQRKEKQPLEFGSAGSTFKRPEGYFAGALIQEAGMKGYSIGDAQVSEKHAGFVINRGNASATEIYQVCKDVQKKVKEISGVDLTLEVHLVGQFS